MKLTVRMQQYVEMIAEVVIDVDCADEEEAIARAIQQAKDKARDAAVTVEWGPGDDAYSVEVYAVENEAGQQVWER